MPEYLSPGVYVEEVPSGPRPIEGVGTSTAGMVGLTERGPTTPRLVTNWGQFRRWYGDVVDPATSFAPFAARGFFENGGVRLFVARVALSDAASALLDLPTATAQLLRVEAMGPGAWGNRLFVRVGPSSRTDSVGNPVGFRITVLYFRTAPNPFVDPLDPANIGNPARVDPDVIEDYDDLSADPLDGNYVLMRMNSNSTLVHASLTDPALDAAAPTATAFAPLAGGGDGAAPRSAVDYEGNPAVAPDLRTGLAALENIDEVALLFVPDEVHPALDAANQTQLMNTLVTQCERLADRFAILNVPAGQGLVQNIFPPRDSSYAAIYYPWIRVFDPFTRDTVLVPPAGHVAGIYARTDRERGVHKAPANEVLRDIITRDINATRRPLEFTLSRGDHDILNPRGINVIRDFRADRRGIRVWGARTLSSDPLWRYVNVRRLFNYVKESVDEGTQWVVFEPNDDNTWARVRHVVADFLTLVWRSGALFGATEEQAFFVRCGAETMTPADIDAGRLIVEVGIAPVKPAEFVIFRFQQKMTELVAP
ncbi:phage tail protein [Massilia sp. CCM 8733]|uniref:Phage tail protein n=1 Tax=Massilia mucilaginosa TaxID=2609282 RepID=A0ABX0NSG9_9BURK|nr:phage tail sheath C-terminal domain-containing protein [Massilia mucilaginosa]NHZ89640.1 phage tail protein [Massilia mucilaginosa]